MHSLSIYKNTKELTRGTTTINKFCISALRQYLNVHVLEYNHCWTDGPIITIHCTKNEVFH